MRHVCVQIIHPEMNAASSKGINQLRRLRFFVHCVPFVFDITGMNFDRGQMRLGLWPLCLMD